jgi:succinate dehydrogenase/fumarate reductase flavoprotein subunit
VNNLPEALVDKIDTAPYSEADFLNDINRMTDDRSNPALAKALVEESKAMTKWLSSNRIRFQLNFNRQGYEIEGGQKFWGGMVLMVEGGDKGLTAQHQANAKRKRIEVSCDSPVVRLLRAEGGNVTGVVVRK